MTNPVKYKQEIIDNAINNLSIPNTELLLIDVIDDNYYGELDKVTIGRQKVDVESIWTDSDGHIMLHVVDSSFEGDIKLFSLPDKQIVKLLKSVKKTLHNHYNN